MYQQIQNDLVVHQEGNTRTTLILINDQWQKLNGEVVDLSDKDVKWLTDEEKELELSIQLAAQARASESVAKMDAYTFKGVSCSVKEADQNGWETINARIDRLLAAGEDWRPIPFFMENGNHVILETHAEWLAFIEAGWQAREAILMTRL